MKYLIASFTLLLSFVFCFGQKTIRYVGFGKRTYVVRNSVAVPGGFNFTVLGSKITSAGVFDDSILVTTLWNNERFSAGTYTAYWDGKDDYGINISSPKSTYKIRVMTSDVKYQWQGTIGNNSINQTGETKMRGYYHCMTGMAVAGSYGYYCTGYSEGSPSFAKFPLSNPAYKIPLFMGTTGGTPDVNFVATDGTKVYYGCFDASANTNSFVFGVNTSNDSEVSFSSGVNYNQVYGRAFPSVISKLNLANSYISGLAVQKTGSYLFVARAGLNQLQVLNKNTGSLVLTLSYTNARAISIDASDNLWMTTGTNTVSKYVVNGDGSLNTASLTLSGLVSPMATQVSFDGSLITVADGGSSQQVKFFNATTGTATNTLGTANGYFADAAVSNSKFYFSDSIGNKFMFLAYQSDGSFWVNDPGNFRVQHFNSSRIFIDRIMSLGSTYAVYVDRNNITRLFSGNLEFQVSNTVDSLTGTSGWSLVNNWGANITAAYDATPRYHNTLSNGKTYAFIRKGFNYEIVEFIPNGLTRFTGLIRTGLSEILCDDGSIINSFPGSVGGTTTYTKRLLTGFVSNNPTWSASVETLATTPTLAVTDPNGYAYTPPVTSTNRVVIYEPSAYISWPTTVRPGYHLGAIPRGGNTWLFKTEKSTRINYQGPFPAPGWHDVGNYVNQNSGGNVNVVGQNIITSYHGEFWKNSQTNMFNHYWDNGLAIGQFGTTRPEIVGHAAAKMAGNALTPNLIKSVTGDSLFLYTGDESDHGALHRWLITGVNTVAEQVIAFNYSSVLTMRPAGGFINLMDGLPFDSVLANTSGWTRNPLNNESTSIYDSVWTVFTSRQSYDRKDNDITVNASLPTARTNNVSRTLGINNSANWTLIAKVAFPEGNNVNGSVSQQFLDILDDAGKVITRFYIHGSYLAPTYLQFNTAIITSAASGIIEQYVRDPRQFEIKNTGGVLSCTYGKYNYVTSIKFDPTANSNKPAVLKLSFINTGVGGTSYGQLVTVQNVEFKNY